jgi:phosphoribosylformimino-5-aminoimidazole carboxamide ribotide isomerase
MILIPAIDLKDGKCVRLRRGVMSDSTTFSDNPLEVAKKWVDLGAKRLHLVDLNGAFAGKPMNLEAVMQITQAFPEVPVQIGGGIRTLEIAKNYIDAGVKFLIIGTKAVEEPEFVKELCQKFPGQIIVGLDANNGLVATDGWAKQTTVKVVDLAKDFENYGVSSIIYTDIARDGMMNGVNVEATNNLANAITIPIIASGGVTNMDDIYNLKNTNNSNIIGAITGRAIYEGSLDFALANKELS